MKSLTKKLSAGMLCAALVMGVSSAGFGGGAKADEATSVIKDHRIGFVETDVRFAVYQTANGTEECPQGLNSHGPREDFNTIYPHGGPIAGTELAREALKVFPQDKPAQFPYIEAQGNIAIGLNLDGKVGPRDFTSPEGEKGIDNAFYRVIGCHPGFRGPDGTLTRTGKYLLIEPSYGFYRMMIEISGVDSLQNDDSVDVTISRGRDPEVLDSSSVNVVPGGSERIDMRFGRKLIQHVHGRIENGVLITDPIKNGVWAWIVGDATPRVLRIHDMRLRLKLSPTNADGLLAGYYDVNSIYRWVTGFSTHHLGYCRLDAPEFYWAVRRNADAYPDQNGVMTAISAAISLNMTQVFIIHPDAPANKQVAGLSVP